MVLVVLIAGVKPRSAAGGDPRRIDRMRSMIWYHGYTVEEAAAGLGLSVSEVRGLMADWRITPGTRPLDADPAPRLRVLAWEPGRHPRIGFLEGAINPLPDTKLSVFLPWEGAGYVVFDLPEAIFSNLGLIWLAHTHIPTVWDEQGIKTPQARWKVVPDLDGGMNLGVAVELTQEITLPNSISFGVTARPGANELTYEYWLRNGTDMMLTGLRSQLCVLLKNAPEFNGQTEENKVLGRGAAAVRSRDGMRWIITECERSRPWQNRDCPCMHADPTFEDCPPGGRVSVRGRIWFYEGAKPPL